MESTDKTSTSKAFLRGAIVAVLLIVAWLVWSGLFKPLLLGLGAFSILLTLYILQRTGYFANETFAFRYNPRLLGFWGWLGKEIVVSSLQVTRVIFLGKRAVKPRIVTLDVSDMDVLDQALLGNSITLTPGTLALDVHEGKIKVHALTEEAAAGLLEGEMQRRVQALRDN